MGSRVATAAKCLLVMVLVFGPYWALVAFVISRYGSHPPRWLGVVGLIYMIGGLWLCVVITSKIFNKQLAQLSSELIARSQEAYGRPDFPGLSIQVAYVSSVTHLKRFESLPWFTKYLGIAPGDFPMVTVSGRSNPIVYFSSGQITLSPEAFKFAACPPSDPWKSYSNLNVSLTLDLKPDQILSVARFDMRDVTSASVRLPFIGVQTSAGELRDFLVCSGSDDLNEIATQTEDLYVALRSFAASKKPVETLH